MKTWPMFVAMMGVVCLGAGCATQESVADEDDAIEASAVSAKAVSTEATGEAESAIRPVRRVCRSVCHRDRFGHRRCRRVCR